MNARTSAALSVQIMADALGQPWHREIHASQLHPFRRSLDHAAAKLGLVALHSTTCFGEMCLIQVRLEKAPSMVEAAKVRQHRYRLRRAIVRQGGPRGTQV